MTRNGERRRWRKMLQAVLPWMLGLGITLTLNLTSVCRSMKRWCRICGFGSNWSITNWRDCGPSSPRTTCRMMRASTKHELMARKAAQHWKSFPLARFRKWVSYLLVSSESVFISYFSIAISQNKFCSHISRPKKRAKKHEGHIGSKARNHRSYWTNIWDWCSVQGSETLQNPPWCIIIISTLKHENINTDPYNMNQSLEGKIIAGQTKLETCLASKSKLGRDRGYIIEIKM